MEKGKEYTMELRLLGEVLVWDTIKQNERWAVR